ncbi:MAG TPA: sigma-54 dependent transcriptional regulator [Tahibacter sp.]|uniref:sigma-54-dependent transcriptional regulator n=1 Tax=Tahibacter sp. TaxID=2056211 RepID=UPI002CFFB557|nr:sigma-54 dependent transcriptional regulator [Tahibacter sp.]HSX62692.1 sigma-54 dependent transcriptional regulator [Tahibacter sp.]
MDHSSRPSLLVVDDDEGFVEAATALAQLRNFESCGAHSLDAARIATQRRRFDLILVDLCLPDGSGFDLVEEIGESRGPVAVVTGNASIATAARAVRLPVSDYLVKPLERSRFDALLEQAQSVWSAQYSAGDEVSGCGDFVGDSPAMRAVYRQIRRVAPTHANVLLVGESGTGKELAARAIHDLSGRSGPFVAVNCGAVAPELLASHLFGHERGSFTGAVRQHRGYFEQAQGGTILLDEITEMPPALQAHLLRVLETRSVIRVGGDSEHALDVRVVAATNRRAEEAMAAGQLREDLFFRLGEFVLQLPPLRLRGGDVALIGEAMLQQFNQRYGADKRYAPDAWSGVVDYAWPGNVRELRNAVHRAFILSDGNLVRLAPLRNAASAGADVAGCLVFPVGSRLDRMQREMLLRTLQHYAGDKARAAEALGISVKTIYNHLARYGDDADA